MCLMLYVATKDDQQLRESPELRVENVEASREAVLQWFSLPVVRFIGAHTGCSCGFPHVIAEEPIEYYDGMFDGEEREADLKSVESLLVYVREHVGTTGNVELYPVGDGEEDKPPKGVIDVTLDALARDTFFFNERFFYRVAANRK
jgi:hypothetical protein